MTTTSKKSLFTSSVLHIVFYIAYFWVHSLAVFSYLGLSILYVLAMSGTRGSSGLGSVSKEQIDNKTENKIHFSKTSLVIME